MDKKKYQEENLRMNKDVSNLNFIGRLKSNKAQEEMSLILANGQLNPNKFFCLYSVFFFYVFIVYYDFSCATFVELLA